MALALTACAGFTSCKDEPDHEEENTTGLTVKGADWKLTEFRYFIEEDDYYDENDACLIMSGTNHKGKRFNIAWYPEPDALHKDVDITYHTYEVYDADDREYEYYPVGGSAVIVDATSKGNIRVSFKNLNLKMDNDNPSNGYPTNVTLNGTVTFSYSR